MNTRPSKLDSPSARRIGRLAAAWTAAVVMITALVLPAHGSDGQAIVDPFGHLAAPEGGGSGGALRVFAMALRDPHILIDTGAGCQDVTDGFFEGDGDGNLGPPAQRDQGSTAFNNLLRMHLEGDADFDGVLDNSPVLDFSVLPQNGRREIALGSAACAVPWTQTACAQFSLQGSSQYQVLMASETCLEGLPGTLAGYAPVPNTVRAPCFVTAPRDRTLDLGIVQIPVTRLRLAVTPLADVPGYYLPGLVRGFLAESVADQIQMPMNLGDLSGMTLSALLPGGAGNCADWDDRDIFQGETGWWLYFDLGAYEVPKAR
ncbi:MAG: hypothetical protein AAF772_04960 [Acidobacteriota bacterium]